MKLDFKTYFGPYAVIAGASQGIGEAFAHSIAKRGINVILIARREAELKRIATEITTQYSVKAIPFPLDLVSSSIEDKISELQENYEINLLIYNAALSPIGPFLSHPISTHFRVIDLNCRGPMQWTRAFLPDMCNRGHGGIILMSSLTAYQGSPVVGHYGATKAYNLSLAEALWDEVYETGVHVMAVTAGATSTPNFKASSPNFQGGIKPPIMTPDAVSEQSLKALRRHIPVFVPGFANRLSSFFLQKLIPRRWAVKIIGNINRKMYIRNPN